MRLSIGKVENARKLSKLCSVLSKISNEMYLIFHPSGGKPIIKIILKTDISDGTEVWYEAPIDYYFDRSEIQSLNNNIIGLQIDVSELKQVLGSILSMSDQETSVRLRRDPKYGTLLKFDIKQQTRTQIITQDLSVTTLSKQIIEELREPELNGLPIMMPPLKHVMGVMDRLKNISDELVIKANTRGHLCFSVETHYGSVLTVYQTTPQTIPYTGPEEIEVKVDIRKFTKAVGSHQLDAEKVLMVIQENYAIAIFILFPGHQAHLVFYLPIKLRYNN